MQGPFSLFSLVVCLLFLNFVGVAPAPWAAGFTYVSFNDTTSLVLLGDARTSNCNDGGAYAYTSSTTQVIGSLDYDGRVVVEETASVRHVTASRSLGARDAADAMTLAAFPHRDVAARSNDAAAAALGGDVNECPLRARLTPSRPFKVGAIGNERPLPALGGWETGFTFQLTDASRSCTQVTDVAFGTAVHRTCSVAGGDGLAFVVHADARGAQALGEGGGGLGYAGLHGALAVQFDSWYNADDGDVPYDHISVHASGAGGVGMGDTSARIVTANAKTSISGAPRRVDIADGLVHAVRVAYVPYLKMDWAPYFVASEALTTLIGAAGSAAPLGTLAMWYDVTVGAAGGCGNGTCAGEDAGSLANSLTPPTLALPIALNRVLQRDGGDAWFALTAATGSTSWQKHDILSWYWCGALGCPQVAEEEAVVAAGGHADDDGRWWSPFGNGTRTQRV